MQNSRNAWQNFDFWLFGAALSSFNYWYRAYPEFDCGQH